MTRTVLASAVRSDLEAFESAHLLKLSDPVRLEVDAPDLGNATPAEPAFDNLVTHERKDTTA
jgi:hypothetical protein